MGQAAPGIEQTGLNERELQMLMFERQWWRYEGSKDRAIRQLFGMKATRYYQLLSVLIDSEAAYAFDPHLVARLRRGREQRYRARSARRLPVLDRPDRAKEAELASPTDRL